MESFSLLVVAVALLSAVRGETGRTVDDYVREKHQIGLAEDFLRAWYFPYTNDTLYEHETFYEDFTTHHAVQVNLTIDAFKYSAFFYLTTMLHFFLSVGNVSDQSLRQEINVKCGESLERRWSEITNKTCMKNWWNKWIEVKFQEAQKKFPVYYSLQNGSRTRDNCTLVLEDHFVKGYVDIFNDIFNMITFRTEYNTIASQSALYESLYVFSHGATEVFYIFSHYLAVLVSESSIEPFKYDNFLRANFIKFSLMYATTYFQYEYLIKSQKQLSWGIIRSSHGKLEDQCLLYRDIYTWDSDEYIYYSFICNCLNILQSQTEFLRCTSKDVIGAPLSWSTVPSAFFHSQCLCLAYNGTDCRVKAPEGVEPLTYCLSVLVRDFQKQVSVRPALTYLDYSFMTKVPTCQFTNLLQQSYFKICQNSFHFEAFGSNPVECSFYGLLNDTLNCSEISMVSSYNTTFLCNLHLFMSLVHCDADADSSVPFYSPGASTLVKFLTFLDVSVRTLTLVTYLSCPQLRNLPGKLLIGYQVTALLRLLVVRATLEDLAVAVRIDVASDLSSTLWLTSFLHFLTSSLRTLRIPDSLSPQEARVVLLRYCLLGWALPAALSSSFFFLDEAFHSHVQWGQLLFVLCYFVALLWNLYMFYFNCKFYYDVKKDAVSLRPGVKTRTVFFGLFNFALKTSVLSGAGIIFRLLFAQFQGLEELLGYYHALGTLQALLVFFFYGCNRESRDFWRRVLCQKLLPFLRPPQNRVF